MQAALQKLSLRELRLLLIGGTAIVVAALVFSLLMPRIKAMRSANETVAELRAASQDGTELAQLLEDERTKLDELRYRLYGDMADLPVKQIEAYIIGRLQEISWGTSVELVSVEPATGTQVQIFQEMLFNVQLAGHYGDLYHWLWSVRNELGYVVIKEYSLGRQNDDDEDPVLVANLSLASYRAER